MPKINNVEFLTLPQQVSKNKRDVQDNTQDIASLNQTVDNIQAGISNIPMLNNIVINAVGVPQALTGMNKAILLDNLKNQALIKGEDKTISWALHLQVLGSLVGDSAFPNTLVDYDINLSNITYAGSDTNRFYRVRGFSRDFTFVVECNIDTTNEGWMFTVDPTIMMATVVQPSTYYTQASNIVGGVVLLSNLSPSGAWIKAGDLVISGSAIYIIQSITGNQATLTAQTGFVAPTGTFNSYGFNFVPITEGTDKIDANKLFGCKVFNVAGIEGLSLEEQLTALGLTMKVCCYLAYDSIGGIIGVSTVHSHPKGFLFLGLSNSTASTISVTGIQALATSNPKLTSALYQTATSASSIEPLYANYNTIPLPALSFYRHFVGSSFSITAGNQANYCFFF